MKTSPHTPGLIRQLTRPLALTLALSGASAVALTSGTMATASTAAATTTCAATVAPWGSLAKSLNRLTPAPITNVRAGRTTCFDRIVVDLAGKGAGYKVQYVSQVLSQGQGAVVALRGSARIEVVVKAPTYNVHTGASTYRPANPRELVNVAGFTTFRQIAYGGSFEGYTTIGLGVRARLPMRAFILDGPGAGSRVVIDVAHQW